MKIEKISLDSYCDRQSFYHKCYIERNGKTDTLYSYDTPVMRYVNGKPHKIYGGYSATTVRHINAANRFEGIPYSGKAWWEGLKDEG